MIKFIKKSISFGATAGYLFYLAAFTFVGALLFTPLFGWCVAAVIFAVLVEGTVYATNIYQAIKNSDYEKILELALAEQTLKKEEQNQFRKDYFNLKEHLHTLSKDMASYAEKAEVEKQIVDGKKCLKAMISEYRDYLKGHASNFAFKERDNSFQNIINSRKRWIQLSIPLSFGAGVFSGISAYALIMLKFLVSPVVVGCLAKMGITVVFASTVGAPLLAGLACLGSGLVMYGAASRVIKKGDLNKWDERLDELVASDEPSKLKKYSKRCVAYTAFLFLMVFSMVATAWSFCSPIINFTTNIALRIIAYITLAMFVLLTLLFNADNALRSLKKIGAGITDSWTQINTAWNNENILQFSNPFRHGTSFIMSCHAYSSGMTTDNFPFISIPPAFTALVGAIMEWLGDWDYMPENHHNHDHDHDHDDDHDHGSFLLDTLVFFLNCAAVVWDYVAVALGRIVTGKLADLREKNLWTKSKEKFIPTKPLPDPPCLSEDVKKCVAVKMLQKEEKRYEDKKIKAKKAAFNQKVQQVSDFSFHFDERGKTVLMNTTDTPAIAKRRYPSFLSFFGVESPPPRSKEALCKISNNGFIFGR